MSYYEYHNCCNKKYRVKRGCCNGQYILCSLKKEEELYSKSDYLTFDKVLPLLCKSLELLNEAIRVNDEGNALAETRRLYIEDNCCELANCLCLEEKAYTQFDVVGECRWEAKENLEAAICALKDAMHYHKIGGEMLDKAKCCYEKNLYESECDCDGQF